MSEEHNGRWTKNGWQYSTPITNISGNVVQAQVSDETRHTLQQVEQANKETTLVKRQENPVSETKSVEKRTWYLIAAGVVGVVGFVGSILLLCKAGKEKSKE